MNVTESRSELVHPGAIFGNSFQRVRQALLVIPAGSWTLFLDSGEGTPVETRAFSGDGVVRVEVDPLSAATAWCGSRSIRFPRSPSATTALPTCA